MNVEYNLVKTISYGTDNSVILIKPSHAGIGICGYLWQVIRAIHKYPNEKYYIYIGHPNMGLENENVWDFYFEQPYQEKRPSIHDVKTEVGLIFDSSSEFIESVLIKDQQFTPEMITARRKEFSEIIRQNFKLRSNIQSIINKFKEENFKNKRVMGLHFRGTDHPYRQELHSHVDTISKYLRDYDCLFVSSDEIGIVNSLTNIFKNKIITYNSITRMNRNDPLHSFSRGALGEWSINNNGFNIGKDAIVEANLLSSVDLLICSCESNVNYLSKSINPTLPVVTLFI